MKKLLLVIIIASLLSVASSCPAFAGENTLSITGPMVVDSDRGIVYVAAQDQAGNRWTAVLAVGDGALQRTLDVGGPMALDASRSRLYVSMESGVAVVDTRTGQTLRTLPAIPVTPTRAMADFLPPFVLPQTGEVLVIDGPQISVFGPDDAAPNRTIPFTSEGFKGPNGEPLVADNVVFDAGRGLLYGSFLVHSQTSSGIGGSFTVHEVNVLDVTSGKPQDKLEVYNLYQMAVDPAKGILVVNAGGDAKSWLLGTGWLAERKGLALDTYQGFQLDSQRRQAFARNLDGSLLGFDLDSLDLTGVARLPQTDRLAGYDPATQQFFLASNDGRLSIFHASSMGNTFALTEKDWTAPNLPVRSLTVLPDGRLAAEWEGDGIGFSSDQGASWTGKIEGGSALAVSDSDGLMLASLGNLGVFRSEDGGRTWLISSAGLRNFGVEWIAFSPNYAADRTVYLYARTGFNMFGFPRAGELYRSGDGGKTWQAMPPQMKGLESMTVSDGQGGAYNLAAVRADGPNLGPGTFSLSSDGGVNWADQGTTPAFPVTGGLSLAPLYLKWGVGFIFGVSQSGGSGALYRSADSGKTWAAVWSDTPQDVAWGYSDSWADIAYGPDIEAGRPVFLVLRWNEIKEGVSRVRGALYVSGDGGQTWSEANAPEGKTPTAVAAPGDFAQTGRFYLGLSDGGVVVMDWETIKN